MTPKTYRNIGLMLLFLTAAYFSIFQHLDALPVRFWDEGQNSINALEMIERDSWFIKYFQGKPDLYETKPPFFVWHIILSIKLLGKTELALRLPSALYTLFGALLIIWFAKKKLDNQYIGYTAAFVIISSLGVIGRHNARTGDNDATLVFYLLLSVLSFFLFLHDSKYKRHYYWVFIISLFLAFFTKSIIGFLLLPGMFLYVVLQKKLKYLFTFRDIYISVPIFILLIVWYYWYHEKETPGYLESLVGGELAGRYAGSSTSQFSWYYIENFWNNRFEKWILLVPVSIVSTFVLGSKKYKNLTLYLSLIITITLIILSKGAKNLWYDAPLYPLMGLIIGVGVVTVISSIKQKKFQYSVIALFLIHVSLAYRVVAKKTYKQKEFSWRLEEQGINHYLKDALKEGIVLGELKLIFEPHASPTLFYINVANDDPRNNIGLFDYRKLNKGDIILVTMRDSKTKLHDMYEMKLLDTKDYAEKYEILERKKN